LKRSNRLVLLIGVFLAVVAFVLVVVTLGNPQTATQTPVAPTTGPVVVAKVDIPLSTRIRADQVEVKTLPLTAISAGAFEDPSQVVGQVARQPVAVGAQITATTLSGGVSGAILNITTPAGFRAIAVRVDQTSGVGTIIKAGDYVDAIIGLTEEQFASLARDTTTPGQIIITNPGPYGSTTKLILQGMQVLGTLLPPAAPATVNQAAAGSPAPSVEPGTVLNDQQEIVILAVSAQQAEVIRWAQFQVGRAGLSNPLLQTLSLVLRSPDDFVDPVTGQPVPPVDSKTSGVVLKTLIDVYGVLPPTVVPPVIPSLPPLRP
jgi:Flp pilus assembly protein CpaB